jgi:hypothetical protein
MEIVFFPPLEFERTSLHYSLACHLRQVFRQIVFLNLQNVELG